ncbi:MAG: class I SAM-dependent methyltransferase [Bacteroidales bacterium]|nr:class I SAM-dependent methyltransferase [Bacteroidales bacterium]
MKDYSKITSLSKYVLKEENKNNEELKDTAFEFVVASAKNKLAYEIEWLGVPVIQTPEDLILMQELIFKIKPDIIVETGIAHGGSLIYYASLLELLGKGRVIGIDIDIREHNRKVLEVHPMINRIEMIEGDSLSEENLKKISDKIPDKSTVIVALDSNHTRDHVFAELKKYSRFVTKDSYLVVFDTHTSEMAKRAAAEDYYINNGPMEAINMFLADTDEFIIDKEYNKLFASYCPDGYLKKIK